MNKKIVFLTGTRADFGKLKSLMNLVENDKRYDCHVFVTGMHMLARYGGTYREVENEGYANIYKFINQTESTKMDINLSNTIIGFSNYVHEVTPDLIVVHGDRIEALAAAIVGALNNIRVAHIEGGEMSGTIDESLRHAISKLAHIHCVSNEDSKQRLIQMGENSGNVFVIGSPDLELMVSADLPSLADVKRHYEIDFDRYGIFTYHPVTTELDELERNIDEALAALVSSDENYIVIYPNNDEGTKTILRAEERLKGNPRFRLFPSLRFESFLTLLRNAAFMIGNSSAGIRESEVYGIQTINIGNRQQGRSRNAEIIHVPDERRRILDAIKLLPTRPGRKVSSCFGSHESVRAFSEILGAEQVWAVPLQKRFHDLEYRAGVSG